MVWQQTKTPFAMTDSVSHSCTVKAPCHTKVSNRIQRSEAVINKVIPDIIEKPHVTDRLPLS